jgi:hypothetical protein
MAVRLQTEDRRPAIDLIDLEPVELLEYLASCCPFEWTGDAMYGVSDGLLRGNGPWNG